MRHFRGRLVANTCLSECTVHKGEFVLFFVLSESNKFNPVATYSCANEEKSGACSVKYYASNSLEDVKGPCVCTRLARLQSVAPTT